MDTEREVGVEETRTRKRPTVRTRDQGAAEAAQAQATSVTDALGAGPFTLTLRGKPLTFSPLEFNDLLSVEDRFGDVGSFLAKVNGQDLRAIRFFFWLCLVKAHPELTEEETGRYIPVSVTAIFELVERVVEISGLRGPGGSGGNEEAPG